MTDTTTDQEHLHKMVMGNCQDVIEAAYVGPLSWLHSAIQALEDPRVAEIAQGDDPDSYQEMLREVKALHATGMTAFLRLASRDPEFVAAQTALQLPLKEAEPTNETEMIPF